MKISWGVGLTIFIIFFLLSTLGVVYYTTTVDVHLVADNYYEKELAYQQKINKTKRANDLSVNLKITDQKDIIKFNFPKQFDFRKIAGIIYLYNPTDEKMDEKINIHLLNGYQQLIPTDNMKKGYWKAEVNWNVGDTLFYTEKKLMVR